jgi:hypothetical protein
MENPRWHASNVITPTSEVARRAVDLGAMLPDARVVARLDAKSEELQRVSFPNGNIPDDSTMPSATITEQGQVTR